MGGASHLKVNSGGGDYGDWRGDAEIARAGEEVRHAEVPPIDGVPLSVLSTSREMDHDYILPDVSSGEYILRLYFAPCDTEETRSIQIFANDLQYVKNFAPSKDRSSLERVWIRVTGDHGLSLKILSARQGSDVAYLSAFELISIDEPEVAEFVSKNSRPPLLLNQLTGDVSESVKLLTGHHTRVVWVELKGNPNDIYGINPGNHRIMGFDSDDGEGVRPLVKEFGTFARPLLTPDGERVVFSNQETGEWGVIDFEGTNFEMKGRGYVSDVWEHPDTGEIYVYFRKMMGEDESAIFRVRLDEPVREELVFDRTKAGGEHVLWFDVSPDGKRASAGLPWPNTGVIDLEREGAYSIHGKGCWVSIAPNDSYRQLRLVGNHREVILTNDDGSDPRVIQVNTIPGLLGERVYHTKWGQNTDRLIVLTGPQRSTRTEVYLGRFDPEITRVEDWVKITENDRPDFFGDVWIGEGEFPTVASADSSKVREQAPVSKKAQRWPSRKDGLIWVWENGLQPNEIIGETGKVNWTCDLRFKEGATFTPYYGVDLHGGLAIDTSGKGRSLALILKYTQKFGLELTLRTNGQSGRVVRFGAPGDEGLNFQLMQKDDVLYLETTEGTVKIGEIASGEFTHVALTYDVGRVESWINGQPATLENMGHVDFDEWTTTDCELTLGDGKWSGEVEGIALFMNHLSYAAIRAHYERYSSLLMSRDDLDSVVVEARLVEKSPIPTSEETDYSRAMANDRWKVLKVLNSSAPEGHIIDVARWVLLDRKPVPGVEDLEVGDVRELTLHRWDERPELVGEYLSDQLPIEDLPRYFNPQKPIH